MSPWFDPHIHMISRVTDDYRRRAQCGCAAVSEPAFWAGFDRGSAEGFRDYFRHLVEVEPKRAAQFGIRHYSWLCINAKEAENVALSREVIALIPEYLNRSNVLGIGEIGLNKNTRNEATIFQEHVDLAVKTNELMLIHTPHLEDKYKGTRMIIDMLRNDRRVDPAPARRAAAKRTPCISSAWKPPVTRPRPPSSPTSRASWRASSPHRPTCTHASAASCPRSPPAPTCNDCSRPWTRPCARPAS